MKKLFLAAALAAFCSASEANATVTWTDWTSGAVGSGNGGSALGTMGGVTVTYSGEMECLNCYASHWLWNSTFTGGDVNVAPPVFALAGGGYADSGLQIWGGPTYGGYTDTVTFSSLVRDPVLAIASLGQAGITASYDFTTSEPFVLLGGGATLAWGGSSLTSSGSDVFGTEGNGLVQFIGSYKSISWTVPTYEYYDAVTVGSAVPEPSTWAMLLVGLAALGFAGYRRTKRKDNVAFSAA